MAIVRESTGTSTEVASGSSLILNKPSGVVIDDVLVAVFLNVTGTTSADPITGDPSGWVRLTDSSAANSVSCYWTYIYYKVAGGSEPSTYTWTKGSGAAGGDITRLSGVDTTTPSDATPPAPTLASNSVSVVCPTITTVTDNAWILRIAANVVASSSSYTFPGGSTEYLDLVGAGGTNVSLAAGDHFLTSAGATGTLTVTASVKGANWGMTAAFRPEVVVELPELVMAPRR